MNKKIISSLFILFQILLSQDISPNFSLKKINGRTVKIGEYLENGPVLINFWATWCAPCKKEMVFLEKFENEYKKEGFSVLSISIDSQKSLAQVRSYIRINNYSFDVFLDP